jgi:hypothetical protein
VGRAVLDVHAMLGGAALALIGTQAVAFGLFTKVFAITEGLLPMDPRLSRLFRWVTLETGLVASALCAACGVALVGGVLTDWGRSGFTSLDYSRSMRGMIPGALLLVLGAQGLLSSFFLSILGLARSDAPGGGAGPAA